MYSGERFLRFRDPVEVVDESGADTTGDELHERRVVHEQLVADRDVEIVADRAIAARVSQAEWDGVCREVEDHYRAGRFTEGSVAAVQAVGRLLARHFPTHGGDHDEQPNQPVLL